MDATKVTLEWEGKTEDPVLESYWDVNEELLMRECMATLANDLNTSGALGILNQVCSRILQRDSGHPAVSVRDENFKLFFKDRRLVEEMCSVLGLLLPKSETWDADILALVQQRESARKNREWARSDQLREELKKKGALVEDKPSGQRLKRLSS